MKKQYKIEIIVQDNLTMRDTFTGYNFYDILFDFYRNNKYDINMIKIILYSISMRRI